MAGWLILPAWSLAQVPPQTRSDRAGDGGDALPREGRFFTRHCKSIDAMRELEHRIPETLRGPP
jgi:hypothetical protein